MNYDPIHDAYLPKSGSGSNSASLSNLIDSNDTSESKPHDPVNLSPTRNLALSIHSIVTPQSKSVSILNPEEDEEEEDDDEDDANNQTNDEDDSDEDNDDLDDEYASKKSKRKRNSSNGGTPNKSDDLKKQGGHNKGFRHLKKADGEPFWRKDIQYDFLEELFNDETAVFTNTFPHCSIPAANNDPKVTFSELYVRTLAESSKSSKILKERLIKDKEMGKSVGKVCLLVNAGRMNTTINFVPEMRSSLRTYHSIPSLQADPDGEGSKPLQDTPRLKSILKAVCEGQEHLRTVGDIINNPSPTKPNTNIIQLIFLLSNHYHNIRYHYEEPSDDYKSNTNKFMEFFLNVNIHPKNRAKRFLWLVYTYLETSFTPEELENNPFNPKEIPPVELISDEELKNFDQDTDYEIEFSKKMFQTRLRYLADEEHNSNPKRGNKSKKDRELMQQQLARHQKQLKELGDDVFLEDGTVDLKKLSASPSTSKKRLATLLEKGSKKKKPKRASAAAQQNTTSTPSIASPLSKTVVSSTTDSTAVTEKDGKRKLVENAAIGSILSKNLTTANGLVKHDDTTGLAAHLSNPIDGIEKLIEVYVASTPVVPLNEDSVTSVDNRNNLVNKTKASIRPYKQSNRTISFFNSKLNILNEWLYKFFQYKKSTNNGLLSMEWEDVRYDLVNGVENYLYQQLGKSITSYRYKQIQEQKNKSPNHDDVIDNDSNDAPPLSTHSNSDGANPIPENIISVEYSLLEPVGSGHLPIYDYDKGNIANDFKLNLLSFVNNWFIANVNVEEVSNKSGNIKFDLQSETINFA